MLRSLQRFNGIISNATVGNLGSALSRPLSSRALSSVVPAKSEVYSSLMTTTKYHPIGSSTAFPAFISQRYFYGSTTFHQKSMDDVYVTIESAKTEQSTLNSQSSTSSDGTSESACSQGIPNLEEDEEEDMEEMFVVADPVLGQGNIQEWGGPRRGGSLKEPTRFGDWERKGRCTDF